MGRWQFGSVVGWAGLWVVVGFVVRVGGGRVGGKRREWVGMGCCGEWVMWGVGGVGGWVVVRCMGGSGW